MKTSIYIAGLAILALGVTGCETISENDCLTGAWADYGYEDGLNGRSSDRVADYAKRCGEFGVRPDSQAYLASYERGIEKYCTYERGYERGENGDSYNQACSGPLAVDFAPGYDEGRAVYEIYREHKSLVADYEETLDALEEIRRKLREDDLADGDRKRLIKKERRLEGRADDKRIDIRAFERLHDLRRHDFY